MRAVLKSRGKRLKVRSRSPLNLAVPETGTVLHSATISNLSIHRGIKQIGGAVAQLIEKEQEP